MSWFVANLGRCTDQKSALCTLYISFCTIGNYEAMKFTAVGSSFYMLVLGISDLTTFCSPSFLLYLHPRNGLILWVVHSSTTHRVEIYSSFQDHALLLRFYFGDDLTCYLLISLLLYPHPRNGLILRAIHSSTALWFELYSSSQGHARVISDHGMACTAILNRPRDTRTFRRRHRPTC